MRPAAAIAAAKAVIADAVKRRRNEEKSQLLTRAAGIRESQGEDPLAFMNAAAEDNRNMGNTFRNPENGPQNIDGVSVPVKKEWSAWPPEAHVSDGRFCRRLSVAEISRIQGFPPDWLEADGLTEKEKITALSMAVPPPVSRAIADVIKREVRFAHPTLLEICAGIGGLSYGFDYLTPIACIDAWKTAVTILQKHKPNPDVCVVEGFAQVYDYAAEAGKVGLLCGGPPCRPWPQDEPPEGAADPCDIMGLMPEAIAACEPEAFLFDNIPGLFSASGHGAYVSDLLRRMRHPKAGLQYGVETVILNAANYGVPQNRNRIFILGFRDRADTFTGEILETIQNAATHQDPAFPAEGKKPWVTIRQAIGEGLSSERTHGMMHTTDTHNRR